MFCTPECFSKFPRQGPAEGNVEQHSAMPKIGVSFGFTHYAIQVHVEKHRKLVKAKIKSWDPNHTENTIFKSCAFFTRFFNLAPCLLSTAECVSKFPRQAPSLGCCCIRSAAGTMGRFTFNVTVDASRPSQHNQT